MGQQTVKNLYVKAKDVFFDVMELPTEKRMDFLKAACKNEEDLYREVVSLLSAHNAAEGFLEDISATEVINNSIGKTDKLIGQTIDKYRIIRELGRGGMGVVFLATREDFHQQVALKLIKRGMDSDAILERFAREREILAALNHPFIARLLDGGTTPEDLPFFVMEYVEGVPVDEYCRKNNLTEQQKLEIFRKVCDAVAFAHQKLVIHRDLKPSNILVANDGTPKLLDFGIAKLLSSDDIKETETHQRVLTPAYASPEQLEGKTVDTTSDVYSLGKILSEILESHKTDAAAGPKSKDSRLKTQDSRLLTSDLQAILQTSMRSETTLRYGSVEKFSDDIDRYLNNLPISAQKDTFSYRARKFVSRNMLTLGVLGLIFLLLVGGITATLWEARQAQIARERAERRSENLRKISNSFVVELHNEILNLPGSLHARQLLLTRAVEQLDALAAESEDNPALQDELAQGYYNLGLLPNKDLSQTEQNFQKSIALYTKLLQDKPLELHFNQQLAKDYTELANVEKMRGKSPEALTYLQKAETILESLVNDKLFDFETSRLLYEAESDKSNILYLLGRANEALKTSRQALAIGETLNSSGKNSDEFESLLYVSQNDMCKSLVYLGDYQNALKQLRSEMTVWQEHQKKYPTDTRYNHTLWSNQRSIGIILERIGDKQAAIEALTNSLNIMEDLHRGSPDDVGYQRNTSYSNLVLGQFWSRQNDAKKAWPYFQRALELSEKIYTADPQRGETIADLARIYSSLGHVQNSLGNGGEGLQNLRRSLSFYDKALANDSDNAFLRRDYAETLTSLGESLAKNKNIDSLSESKQFYSKSLEIWRDLQNKNLLSAADLQKPNEVLQKFAKLNIEVAR